MSIAAIDSKLSELSRGCQQDEGPTDQLLLEALHTFHQTQDGASDQQTDTNRKNNPQHLLLAIVEKCLNDGASVNAVGEYGLTPLHWAAERGYDECVALLLEKGADTEKENHIQRFRPLHMAAESGHRHCIESLLQFGADVNATDANGQTSLHWASKRMHVNCIQVLLQLGADTNARDNSGESPLRAIYNKRSHSPCTRALIQHETTMDLLVASKEGNIGFLAFLIREGADIGRTDARGWSPLHWAATNGHISTCATLIDSGAKETLGSSLLPSFSPLHASAQAGQNRCLELMIRAGAHVNATDTQGNTPLHYATQEKRPNCVTVLLTQKANADIANEEGKTALRYAIANKDEKITKLLLNEGAQINVVDSQQKSQLQLAIEEEDLEYLRFLLEHGVNLTNIDSRGASAVHWAAEVGTEECIELILEKNANLIKTRSNMLRHQPITPLQLALKRDDWDIIFCLLKKGSQVNDGALEKIMARPDRHTILCDILASEDAAPTTKQIALEEAFVRLSESEEKLMLVCHAALPFLNREGFKRPTVVLLMMDLYAYCIWIASFFISATRELRGDPIYHQHKFLIMVSVYFIIRELLELGFRTRRYLYDLWNLVDICAIGLVLGGAFRFTAGHSLLYDQSFQRHVIATSAIMCLSFVGYLRTTFLPFSNFVGGISKITWDLFPFAVVTAIIVLAFAFMYLIQEYGEEGFESFPDALLSVFTYLVGGLKDATGLLDVTYGILVVIVLLNVVVAIVSNSWEEAVASSFVMLCRHRVDLLRQVQAIPVPGHLKRRLERFDSWHKSREVRMSERRVKGRLLYAFYFLTDKLVALLSLVIGMATLGLLWPEHVRQYLFEIKHKERSLSRSEMLRYLQRIQHAPANSVTPAVPSRSNGQPPSHSPQQAEQSDSFLQNKMALQLKFLLKEQADLIESRMETKIQKAISKLDAQQTASFERIIRKELADVVATGSTA